MRILHLSALPEDIAIACPASLRALVQAGHDVIDICPQSTEGHRAACRYLGVQWEETSPEKYLQSQTWDLLIAPATQAANPDHEMVGRIARNYTKDNVWWAWAISTMPRLPTLHFSYDQECMNFLQANLHHFEDQRRLHRLLHGRAEMTAAVWRHGTFAEALKESIQENGRWRQGVSRQLDPVDPLAKTEQPGPEST